MNPFETFGLEPAFEVDLSTVEQKYRALQRALHPDRFAQASPIERRASLSRVLNVNEAYRILKDDILRGEALLKLRSSSSAGHDISDPEFLEIIIELREALAEAKQGAKPEEVDALATRISSMQAQTLQGLKTYFSEHVTNDANEGFRQLSRLRYFRRFLEEVSAIRLAH